MKSREHEAPASVWDYLYDSGDAPWRSAGLSSAASGLIQRYATGTRALEVGCGVGDDSDGFIGLGFDYYGLDFSEAAIYQAKMKHVGGAISFVHADFFGWATQEPFNLVYDKGLFHGLEGVHRRNAFLLQAVRSLSPDGIWVTVCGSADRRRADFRHGAIYLRDLVGPAEVYFEVLEVRKERYGLMDKERDFQAWHAAFRRR